MSVTGGLPEIQKIEQECYRWLMLSPRLQEPKHKRLRRPLSKMVNAIDSPLRQARKTIRVRNYYHFFEGVLFLHSLHRFCGEMACLLFLTSCMAH